MSENNDNQKLGTLIVAMAILALVAIFYFFSPSTEETIIEKDAVSEPIEEKSQQKEVIEECYTLDREIFTLVEIMPSFEGCEELPNNELDLCTKKKIHLYASRVEYPQEAVDNDIEGKVYISFVVDKKGKVTEVKLLRGVDKLLDEAALKHISKMPDFVKPGFQKGEPVNVKYNIPINFKLA